MAATEAQHKQFIEALQAASKSLLVASASKSDATMFSHENWTTRDLAAYVRAPESTVRYWRSSGQGPRYFKLGKRVLYRREHVLAWLAECQNNS